MSEYPKIESVFVRDERTHKFVDGAWRLPEFAYLKDCEWIWEEKVDGSNVRCLWDGEVVRFGGKTDNAQIYVPLLNWLMSAITTEKVASVFPKCSVDHGVIQEVCLYGEGYGAKIQKGGGNYLPDRVSFVLFDIRVGRWWLKREDVEDIGRQLDLNVVPIMGKGPLHDAVSLVKQGFNSSWGKFPAEGLVCRPAVDLVARNGHRIITKIKTKDW